MADKTLEIAKAKQGVDDLIISLKDKIPAKDIPMVKEFLTKILVDEISPKEAMKIPQSLMEAIYQQGYLCFQSGKYKEAFSIFSFLRMLDGKEKRYTFALAATHHYKKEYLLAAANYTIYQTFDPFNPTPSFHLYDCYLKAGYPEAALYYLQQALVLAEREPQHAQLKEKIQLEMESMKELFKERFKKQAEENKMKAVEKR